VRLLLVVLVVPLVLVACGGDDDGTVAVFAAASLTDVFAEIAVDVDVDLTFAASSQLVAQIEAGAAADVLATADESTMAEVSDDAVVFARNRLTIAVETGNPLGIGSLDDLADEDVLLAMCAPAVPCGRLGALALEKGGVEREPTTFAENARAALTAVDLGEVDAAVVYVTDVRSADGAVDEVEIDIADDPALEAAYPIAALTAAGDAFVELVLADEGQSILRRHGFLAP
jgi:molybdate transport system substrate-binding protein